MKHYTIECTAASHIGGRDRNEDNFLIPDSVAPVRAHEADICTASGRWDTSTLAVAAVCDGIGGGAEGDTASRIALQIIHKTAAENQSLPLQDLALVLAEEAHRAVRSHYLQMPRSGGCTLSMALLREDQWAYLNIGDSPAFLWQKEAGALTELSRRHNLEWEKRRMGIPPEPDDSCMLIYFLGRWDCTVREMAQVRAGQWNPGDGMLLCSDGVTNACPDPAQLMQTGARSLVENAVKDPWSDNSTAVCLWAEET